MSRWVHKGVIVVFATSRSPNQRLLKRRLPGACTENVEAVAPVEARSRAGSSTNPVLPVQKQHLKSKQRKDKVPCTRDPSPNQKRGRQATLSRSSLKERFSLDGILTSTPIEIAEIAIDVGILKNNATEQCSCGQTAWKLEQRQHYCNLEMSKVPQDCECLCRGH